METQSENLLKAEARQQAAGKSPLPEMRMVLLGRRGTGKSSAGNTILGLPGAFESGKPTEECVKRRADIAGHRVTVVDTPGWEWYYSSNSTPGWVRRETMRSVSLCPPGPQALLLVVRSCASVTEDYYRQIEGHLELLGKMVWDHTMLLFTRGDELAAIPIEQRIQNGGKPFQKLLERCGNRYHVLDNKRRGDDRVQVEELMKKIVIMMKERGGRHYESDLLLPMLEVEAKRRARERRKKQRIMEAQAQRGSLKTVLSADTLQTEDLDERILFTRGSRHLPELRLILLGERETGKSSAGNVILRGSSYFQGGQATEECLRQQAEVSGRLLTVIDVPGWEGGPEGITPERVKREISVSVTLCPPGPHALLLTLRVDALVRAPAVREHLELLGEGAWKHTILLFTRGDQLREGVTIEQHIQGGGRDLQWLMEKCGNRYHVISSVDLKGHSSSTDQVTGLLEKIEKMVAGNRCEAFSPLVHEIQELGKQKNERFNQKLKEANDKVQRKEMELKKMREREVKSIRWFFDRRKDKGKSPEKMFTEKEEAMDRVDDDRKSIMSELEDRMAWLTEDKEREIEELNMENSRAVAALKQGIKEKEELVMRLEEKEMEIDELKEKMDELQVKLLELERVSICKEKERKGKEEELRKIHDDSEMRINMLKEKLCQTEREAEELKKGVKEAQINMEQSKLKYEEEVLHRKQEIEGRIAEKNEFENKLEEKQRQMEEMKLIADNKVQQQEARWREMNEKRELEKNKLRDIVELMTKEMEELQAAYQEQVKTTEAERRMHEDTVAKYNELVDKLLGKDAEIVDMQEKQKQQLVTKNIEAQEKLQEKDDEITLLTKRHNEKEQEIELLKQSIDVKQRTMENVQNESHAKIMEVTTRIKHLEDENKEMEEFLKRENTVLKEEIEILLKQHEESNRKKEDTTRQILEMKENKINQLQQQNEDREAYVEELKKQLKENQLREENILNQNATLMQELEGLELRCEEYKRDLQAETVKNQSREKEIKDILNEYDEMGKIKDTLSQEHIAGKEQEISLLKQKNHTQHVDLEALKEKCDQLKKQFEEMKKHYEDRINELCIKDAEREQVLQKRETELLQKEQMLRQNVEKSERDMNDLKKREDETSLKEKELREEMQRLVKREQEVGQKEKDVENQCQHYKTCMEILDRQQNELNRKEKDLTDREQTAQQHIKIKYEDCEAMEKMLANKEKAQRNLSEKQEKEIEHIRQVLKEREDKLKTKEEELVVKQCNIMKEMKNFKKQRENTEIKELNLSKREQQLEQIEQGCEVKTQELSNALQELENNKMDNEKWQAELTHRESELERQLNEFHLKKQEVLQKEHDLSLKTRELMEKYEQIEEQERKLLNKQQNQEISFDQPKTELEASEQTLAIKQQEMINVNNELERRKQELTDKEKNVHIKEQQINKRYDECEAAEKLLESKQEAQKDSSKKLEKEWEMIRHQLEERENEVENMDKELAVRQLNLSEELEDLEKCRENMEIREVSLSKRQQQLMESEKICELKTQELSKALQELENNKLENSYYQAELTKTNELNQCLHEFQANEKERECDFALKSHQPTDKKEESETCEQARKQQHQVTSTDKLRMEFEIIKKTIVTEKGEMINTQNDLKERDQDFTVEMETKNQHEDSEVWKSKKKSQKDICEKLEHETENIRQQLEEKENELQKLEKELLLKQQKLMEEIEKLKEKKENLNIREISLSKREAQLAESEEVCDEKTQEMSKAMQEVENNRQDNEKWQAELTCKEYSLAQKLNELQIKEQDLLEREQAIGLKASEQIEKSQETETYQPSPSKQRSLTEKKWEIELEDIKQALAIREQELTAKQDELQKREQSLKSAEICLDKKEKLIEKREQDMQFNKQQLDTMVCDLKEKEDKIDEIRCSIEMKQQELDDLKEDLMIREQSLITQEQYVRNRYKELDDNTENHKVAIKLREDAFKKQEQELNELTEMLESRRRDLESCTQELQNQKEELNNEQQTVMMKTEELEKWEKYLYNMELKMINKNPSSDYQPWNQTRAFNRKPERSTHNQNMYQEVSTDSTGKGIEALEKVLTEGNHNQSIEMVSPSETTMEEIEATQLVGLRRSKRALEATKEVEGNKTSLWEEEKTAEEEDGEEFFEPASSDYLQIEISYYLASELRVVLLGEMWSSPHSGTRTILGQDQEPGKSWKGNVSGKPLMVVEPHGIKWRSERDGSIINQKDFMNNVSLCSPGPHAFILLLPAYLTFTSQYRRSVESTMAVLGKSAWRHTIVLFTWGEALGERSQQHIKRNGDLQWLVRKCSGRYHVLDNRHREAHVVELLEKVNKMVAENKGQYYNAE